jgi:leader peptidase (prepilin peptidase)/N-methyltransferase
MPYDLLPPAFWVCASAAFGLVIGSFLNVVIYRWPRAESIVFPGSHCGSCGAAVKPYDNIPVLSYAILGGRCRACREPYSMRYPAVEALTGLLFAAACYVDGPSLRLVFDCIFISLVVPLVFIDADVRLLPAVITHPGLVFALVARIVEPNLVGLSPKPFGGAHLLGIADSPAWFISFVNSAAGATLGGGMLFSLGVLYRIVRKREGMGLGDVSMMCMVGAYLGAQLTLLTILVASLVGSVVGIALSRGRSMGEMRLPFGVFLGIGAIVALLAGVPLVEWYAGFFRGR